jgi:hypothetical protein
VDVLARDVDGEPNLVVRKLLDDGCHRAIRPKRCSPSSGAARPERRRVLVSERGR